MTVMLACCPVLLPQYSTAQLETPVISQRGENVSSSAMLS